MADLTNEGIEAGNAFTAANRKAAAFNALSKAYGPAVAYDPATADSAAKASAQMPLAPAAAQTAQDQAQANLTTTNLTNQDTQGTQQRNAGVRAAMILKSTALPDGSIPPEAFDKIVRPNAALLGIDPAHIDQFGQMLGGPGGAQHLDSVAQGLQAPQQLGSGAPVVIKDAQGNGQILRFTKTGQPVYTALPKGAETVSQQRVDTGNVNAATGQVRAQTGQYAAQTGRMREGVYAANQPFAAENPVSGGAPGASGAAPVTNTLFDRLPPKGKAAAISTATSIVNTGTNLANTNQIIGNVLKQISPYTAGSGSLLKSLPGTQQADLKANLATLKAQGLMSWIASLKNQNGQTGIGRVLQSEANAATNLYGNMEQDQSAKQLAFHATLFKQTVNRLYQHSNQAFKAMYGKAPHEAIGSEEPNTSDHEAPQFAPQAIVDELRKRKVVK